MSKPEASLGHFYEPPGGWPKEMTEGVKWTEIRIEADLKKEEPC